MSYVPDLRTTAAFRAAYGYDDEYLDPRATVCWGDKCKTGARTTSKIGLCDDCYKEIVG